MYDYKYPPGGWIVFWPIILCSLSHSLLSVGHGHPASQNRAHSFFLATQWALLSLAWQWEYTMIGILWNGPMEMQESVAKWWKCVWTFSFFIDPSCKLTPGQFLRGTKQLLGTFNTSTSQRQPLYLLPSTFSFSVGFSFILSNKISLLMMVDEARFTDPTIHILYVCLINIHTLLFHYGLLRQMMRRRKREKWPRGWWTDRTERNFPIPSTRVP